MTDASGVPTNPDLIPTYNTSVDAPSGLGFNTAMAQLQAILTNLKAGTLASGKILPAGISWTGAYPFTNADIAAAAALAVSKLAPGANTQILTTVAGVPTWAAPTTGVTYRKTTATAVNTTVAATDLLAGSITVAANALNATGFLRFSASGDWLQNSGAGSHVPRFQVKLGATTLFDTGVGDTGSGVNSSATRGSWFVRMTLAADNATNVQSAFFEYWIGINTSWAGTLTNPTVIFTTGTGISFGMANNLGSGSVQGSAYNTSAEDMTLAKALVLNTINGSASATYETKLTGALVEII